MSRFSANLSRYGKLEPHCYCVLWTVLWCTLWFLNVYVVEIAWNGWCVVGLCKIRLLRAVKLAQASMSRPGEASRGLPRPSRASGRLGDSLNFEHVNVSPRRGKSRLSENVRRPLFQIRELSPRRRGLAWARDSRLGETPQPERRSERECDQFGVFISFGGWTVFYCTIMWWYERKLPRYACMSRCMCIYIDIYDGLLCMRDMINEWWVLWEPGMWDAWAFWN